MIKTLNKVGMEYMYLNLIIGDYENTTINIIPNGEK